MENISFESISPSAEQIQTLYKMLVAREHGISHKDTPSFEMHEGFVRSNPYRAWYMVLSDGEPIGAFYISEENTVGINITDQDASDAVGQIISYVAATYAPLPEIKSVRGASFAINVAPDNEFLINALERLNKKILQISYSFD